MKREVWKDIDGFPGYRVSSLGRVCSLKKRGGAKGWSTTNEQQRVLRPSTDTGGYMGVRMTTNSKRTWVRIHQLVARAFLGPCPEGKEVCHNDGDQTNNQPGNLRYDTHLANMRESRVCKLTPSDIQAIRAQAAEGGSSRAAIAQKYGISETTAASVYKGRYYQDVAGPLLIGKERPRINSSLSYDDGDEIRRRYADGETQAALAREYKCHYTAISHIVHNRRLVRPGTKPIAPKQFRKLTLEQHKEIARRIVEGENRAEIAREYGITIPYTYKLAKKYG